MDHERANQLGEYLRQRREALGYSARALGRLSGVKYQTLLRIEQGEIKTPGPDKLKALAKALDLHLRDVWTVAGYGFDSELPAPLAYLRAKYRHLPIEVLSELSDEISKVLERFGLEPNNGRNPSLGNSHGPMPSEDEDFDLT